MSEPQGSGPQGVSVITPVYNEVEWLETTVSSILALSADEWIWVDDGSTDGSADLLSALIADEPRAHLIRFPVNRGRATARNAAIERATQPWLAFVNANVRPFDGFLEAHSRALKAHPHAVASVGHGVFTGSDVEDPYYRYLAQGYRGPQRPEGPVPWRFFVTTGSVVRRSRVLEARGFPDAITYGVDPALASRLRRNTPHGLVYSPQAQFELLGPSSLEGILEKLRSFGTSLVRLREEDPTILTWTRLSFIEKPLRGALLRSERIARFVRSLAARTQGLPQRLSVRYLLAHATAVGFYSSPRTP